LSVEEVRLDCGIRQMSGYLTWQRRFPISSRFSISAQYSRLC
jgi:hypothetical protein